MSDSRDDRQSSPSPEATDGKGRPTPKRRTSEQANKRPLVPSDRRAAAQANRAKMKEARARTNRAMLTGDDRYLPARDRGPVRRYIRDFVDARWSVGEFFLPASLVIVAVVLLAGNRPTVAVVAILVIYVVIFAAVLDAFLLSRRLKKRLRAKFGVAPKGTAFYGAMRAFQLRRTRLPRPMVKRGEYPV